MNRNKNCIYSHLKIWFMNLSQLMNPIQNPKNEIQLLSNWKLLILGLVSVTAPSQFRSSPPSTFGPLCGKRDDGITQPPSSIWFHSPFASATRDEPLARQRAVCGRSRSTLDEIFPQCWVNWPIGRLCFMISLMGCIYMQNGPGF